MPKPEITQNESLSTLPKFLRNLQVTLDNLTSSGLEQELKVLLFQNFIHQLQENTPELQHLKLEIQSTNDIEKIIQEIQDNISSLTITFEVEQNKPDKIEFKDTMQQELLAEGWSILKIAALNPEEKATFRYRGHDVRTLAKKIHLYKTGKDSTLTNIVESVLQQNLDKEKQNIRSYIFEENLSEEDIKNNKLTALNPILTFKNLKNIFGITSNSTVEQIWIELWMRDDDLKDEFEDLEDCYNLSNYRTELESRGYDYIYMLSQPNLTSPNYTYNGISITKMANENNHCLLFTHNQGRAIKFLEELFQTKHSQVIEDIRNHIQKHNLKFSDIINDQLTKFHFALTHKGLMRFLNINCTNHGVQERKTLYKLGLYESNEKFIEQKISDYRTYVQEHKITQEDILNLDKLGQNNFPIENTNIREIAYLTGHIKYSDQDAGPQIISKVLDILFE